MSHARNPSAKTAATASAERALDRARQLLGKPAPGPVFSLKKAMRTTAIVVATVSVGMASLALGDTMPHAQIAPRSDIDIRVGRNAQSGRIEIYGSVGSRASVRREKDQVVIRLPGQKTPDLGDIRANPPIGIADVEIKQDDRASELWLKVNNGFESRFGRADGAVYVQIDPSANQAAESKKTGAIAVNLQTLLGGEKIGNTQQAARVPVVALQVADAFGARDISFPFAGPVAAAVFRRGDSIWVVFDTEVDLRLPPELKDGKIIQNAQWTHNDGFTALRLTASTVGSVSVANDGLIWRVRLGGKPLQDKVAEADVVRDDSTGVTGLNINLAGASRIAWIRDPVVGDRMAVIPARAPVKSLVRTRTLLEATLASTAQGAAIYHMAPDVKVAVEGDLVLVSRPQGLTLSSPDKTGGNSDMRLAYKNALYPAMINPDWAATPQEGFLSRYNALQAAAADEAQLGATATSKARLSLARFLVGQGLSYEAQGVLDLLAKNSPRTLEDPQVRGLRVVARMLSGRYSSAESDLASPQLANDPATRLWAAYAERQNGHHADAVKDFKAGLKALDQFSPEWRARLATAYATSALDQKDLKTAETMIQYAIAQAPTSLDKLAAYLVDARIIEAQGDTYRALKVYQAVARASDDSIAAPAAMQAAMIKYQMKDADAAATLQALDNLRFRWRGDDTELQLISNMGQIYLSEGRYREALVVLKGGGSSFMNQPQAIQIQTSLNQAFRGLFLGGMADGLQPVEALGLFNDFKDLTPIGSDGDEMVRRIVRRLVDVDLLDQAADLLEYQINNRLDGVAKSSVAADLAAIYLMDHNPQKALQALWNTRTTLLPRSVMAERRVLEARALTELNEPDKALDVLGKDVSPEANEVRADIYWLKKDYVHVGPLLEKELGDRWKNPSPLTPADESRLLRAAVAYSLQKDQASL
ncbi:MAG: tetratricopeptide repeat protein, partial [Asticcacaulis sp.]